MSTANQRASLPWALFAIVPMMLSAGACFGPEYGDSAFQCSSEGECPSDYECRDDGLCYRNGTTGGEAVDGDGCAEAILLSADASTTGSASGARDSANYSCGADGTPEVYFTFTIATESSVSLSLGSAFDSSLVLLTGFCDVEVQCVAETDVGEVLLVDSLPAGTYFVVALGPAATSLSVVSPDSDDEATFTVPIPFGFEFFGAAKTSVNIHTNGFLSFAPIPGGFQQSNFLNDCLDGTTPFDMIAVFWDDHLDSFTITNPDGDQTLKHQVLGEAPNRKLVVEWLNFDLFDSSTCSPDFLLFAFCFLLFALCFVMMWIPPSVTRRSFTKMVTLSFAMALEQHHCESGVAQHLI